MFILTMSTGKRVAFFLPEGWEEHRGDVCAYADGAGVSMVRRDEPGYWPIDTFLPPSLCSRPMPVALAEDEAEELALVLNRGTFRLLDDGEIDTIVASSMRAQAQGGAA